ncbi:MAG: methionine adenosyltransferase [Candidatus Odinarchaeota archaeon]|nr:methionine adenosyltransferase [Candidatus Odinarchaeota archaeon]
MRVEKSKEVLPSERKFEIVERKGLGHPDTICDSIVEEVSVNLSKYYLEEFGTILHHNIDKGTLVGGASEPIFGGGEILEPIYLLIVGRATTRVLKGGSEKKVPIGSIVLSSTREYIRRNFRYLDPDKHIIIDYKIRQGSQDLIRVFESSNKIPKANDTSVGVSFAPLTDTEKLVLNVEKYLNSKEFKERYPAVGEDIKVMGLRLEDKITLTVAAAIVSREVSSLDEYIELKEKIREEIMRKFRDITDSYEILVNVNTADDYSSKNPIIYLTVTGTSAEAGDDGQVGRGNRINVLITPYRPMSLEAVAGKNSVNHVGKIYNILAYEIAERIVKEKPEVKSTHIEILSQIGAPIDHPQAINASVRVDEEVDWNVIVDDITSIIEDEIDNVTRVTEKVIERRVLVC